MRCSCVHRSPLSVCIYLWRCSSDCQRTPTCFDFRPYYVFVDNDGIARENRFCKYFVLPLSSLFLFLLPLTWCKPSFSLIQIHTTSMKKIAVKKETETHVYFIEEKIKDVKRGRRKGTSSVLEHSRLQLTSFSFFFFFCETINISCRTLICIFFPRNGDLPFHETRLFMPSCY